MRKSLNDLARRLSLSVLLASGLGAPAMAANSTESVVVVRPSPTEYDVMVTAKDLDLHSAIGVAGLRHRVRIAAVKLCGIIMPTASLMSDARQDCTGDAVHVAKPQVDSMIAEGRSDRSFAMAGP